MTLKPRQHQTIPTNSFDYVGILWMSDFVWRGDRWQVNPDHIQETGTKRLLSAARKEKQGFQFSRTPRRRKTLKERSSSFTRTLRSLAPEAKHGPNPLRPSRLPHPPNPPHKRPVFVVRGRGDERQTSRINPSLLAMKMPRKISSSSYSKQTIITKALSDMVDEIAALEAKLSKACQLKHGMMQELLTGKTRLV